MSKRKVRKIRETPVVVKVTVTHGQTRVILPKKTAVRLNIMTEEGEPGSVEHLLVTTYRNRVKLYGVDVLEQHPWKNWY